MDRKSALLATKVDRFRLPLTRVHRDFKSDQTVGCSNVESVNHTGADCVRGRDHSGDFQFAGLASPYTLSAGKWDMEDPTPLYAYLSRNLETVNGKPRFTSFMPADDRTSDVISEQGPIAPGRPLRFVMDALDLRCKDNWPGEIGHINVSGTTILVSAAVRDRIFARSPSGLSLSAAVLEDISGQFIEPLYHLSVYERQNVWDREKSEYPMPFDPARDTSANLDSIVLDPAAVANLSDTARLILRLAEVSPPAILFDAAFVADRAREGLTLGAVFYPLPEWFDGIEYQ